VLTAYKVLTAYTPVWNDRGKALATNSFAYPKPGRQAAAIRAKGNKRRRQRGSLGGKLVFVVLNERSFMTTIGRSGVCGFTVIVAACVGVVASKANTIDTRRCIHPR
jgi:hypothetical protein